MSLVAYDASSDEESDYEDNENSKVVVLANNKLMPSMESSETVNSSECDKVFQPRFEENERHFINNLSKLLPKPKQHVDDAKTFDVYSKPKFAELPTPRASVAQNNIQEIEDEFLLKKPFGESLRKAGGTNEVKKLPVKITVPALKNFKDVDIELEEKARNKNTSNHFQSSVASGLLSILPKAKSEQSFSKVSITSNTTDEAPTAAAKQTKPTFVPDSVKHKRPATNTEEVERVKQKKHIKKTQNKDCFVDSLNTNDADSDDDNSGACDFFSLNVEQSLPEVSASEISSLIARKAAKMSEASTKFLQSDEAPKTAEENGNQLGESGYAISSNHSSAEKTLNSDALQALVGGSTKRRRKEQANIQFVELDSSQVMPNKDEWMRTALASATTYQPTGVLVDEEPASGTRRKHQITYLAHKAKANEAELQAMWSANRQNRRATQSKYGF